MTIRHMETQYSKTNQCIYDIYQEVCVFFNFVSDLEKAVCNEAILYILFD